MEEASLADPICSDILYIIWIIPPTHPTPALTETWNKALNPNRCDKHFKILVWKKTTTQIPGCSLQIDQEKNNKTRQGICPPARAALWGAFLFSYSSHKTFLTIIAFSFKRHGKEKCLHTCKSQKNPKTTAHNSYFEQLLTGKIIFNLVEKSKTSRSKGKKTARKKLHIRKTWTICRHPTNWSKRLQFDKKKNRERIKQQQQRLPEECCTTNWNHKTIKQISLDKSQVRALCLTLRLTDITRADWHSANHNLKQSPAWFRKRKKPKTNCERTGKQLRYGF